MNIKFYCYPREGMLFIIPTFIVCWKKGLQFDITWLNGRIGAIFNVEQRTSTQH